MDRRVATRNLRRTASRDKQANGIYTILSAELARELEANQCSQAVAEDNKGLVQKRRQRGREHLDERRHLSEKTLHQPGTPSGKLDRTDLDIHWQSARPRAKYRGI